MTHFEWFDADKITAAGYAGGETAADRQQVDHGYLAVEIEGHVGTGAIFQGTKSELLRFATDIIEATLIADARAKDKQMRLAALQHAEHRVEDLKVGRFAVTLTPEQAAAFSKGNVGGYSIAGQDLEAPAEQPRKATIDDALTAFGDRIVTPELRRQALLGDGKVGKYTIAELEAMPMDQYLAACQDILGTTEEPE